MKIGILCLIGHKQYKHILHYLDFECNVAILISHIHVNDDGFSKKFNIICAFHEL